MAISRSCRIILYDTLLLSVSFIHSHTHHLACLLYFSPYILQLFFFLFPLLLTTSIIVSILSARFVVEGKTPTACLLTQVSSLVVDSIGNVFQGDETVGEVREDPAEVFVQSPENSELSQPNFKLYDISSPNCDISKDSVNVFQEKLAQIEVQELQDLVSLNGIEQSLRKSDVTQVLVKTSDKSELLVSKSERRGSFNSENASRILRNSLSVRRTEQEGSDLEGLQREGSMRMDKERKKTMACKLYEEKLTVKLCEKETEVEEGYAMDLLWENYEADTNKLSMLKSRKKDIYIVQEDDQEEDDEEDGSIGQTCCLQALRLSAGKMNFGTGKPNIGRFSNAFRGVSFFHRSSGNRK